MNLPFGDDPIARVEDDMLGRERLAEVLADEIAGLDARQGAVVAITGPWGSGKTSLMNLTAARLKDDPNVLGIVEFNPWLFAGAEQLAEALLTELATQLRDQESKKAKTRRVATTVTSKLLTYSKGLSVLRAVPTVGPIVDAADKGLQGANTLLKGDQSLQRRRDNAVKALAGLDRRVVVLVDDIDRLTRSETRDLFRTVRLSASFPNIVYLLCLDHTVVAGALNEEGFSGKAYLEKILTVTCRVPELADHHIGKMFTDGLNQILGQHLTGPDNDENWAQAYYGIIRPLFTTVRDAKRVLASLPITLRMIKDELPVPDVVVLECLRTLYPDLHAALGSYSEALTQPPSQRGGREAQEARLSEQIAAFIAIDEQFGGRLAVELVRTVFRNATGRLPDKQAWFTSSGSPIGSVGWPEGLNFYLTHEMPPGVAPAGSVRAIIESFGDEEALRHAFGRLGDDRLEDALTRLFEPSQVVTAEVVPSSVRVLLELFPRLRTADRGMLDFGAHFAVTRPVLQLLRHLGSEAVFDLAERLVRETPTIFGAFELVTLVGHKPNAGHQLVSEEQSQQLEELLRQRITSAGDQLAGERDLATVLFHSCTHTEGQPDLPEVMALPVAATLLKTGVAVTRSQSIGPAPTGVKRSFRLHWDLLTTIYGGEDRIRTVRQGLRESNLFTDDVELQTALDLADRYLDGWRPPDPFEGHSFDN
jgi:ABC-type branched-subunit amino acid transport system ATPase component